MVLLQATSYVTLGYIIAQTTVSFYIKWMETCALPTAQHGCNDQVRCFEGASKAVTQIRTRSGNIIF